MIRNIVLILSFYSTVGASEDLDTSRFLFILSGDSTIWYIFNGWDNPVYKQYGRNVNE